MAPKRKTSPRQTKFLMDKKLAYKAAQATGQLATFWIDLYKEWFGKWQEKSKEDKEEWELVSLALTVMS